MIKTISYNLFSITVFSFIALFSREARTEALEQIVERWENLDIPDSERDESDRLF